MNLKNTALLLIDLQKEEGTSEIPEMEDILTNAKTIINMSHQIGIPVIYTRHINRAHAIGVTNGEPLDVNGEPIYYHSKTPSIEIANEIEQKTNDIVIDKYRYSGFYESDLNSVLNSLNIKHLIIGGVLTDVCVDNGI